MTSSTTEIATGPSTSAPDLREIGRDLQASLRANRRPAITDASQLDVQALCVAEEAGELVAAYRRWAGKARRTGTRRDLEDEIADVLITTAVFAASAGIDPNAAITRKLAVVYSRGWRDDSQPGQVIDPCNPGAGFTEAICQTVMDIAHQDCPAGNGGSLGWWRHVVPVVLAALGDHAQITTAAPDEGAS